MRCPICGREMPGDVTVCEYCGTDLAVLQESLTQEAPVQDAQPSSVDVQVEQPEPELKSKKRLRPVLVCGCLALVTLLGICIAFFYLRDPQLKDGYVSYDTHIYTGLTEEGLAFAIQDSVYKDPNSNHASQIMRSLDGKVLAYTDGLGKLSVFQNGTVLPISTHVAHFELSSNGKALLYSEPLITNVLYYHNIQSGQSVAICPGDMTRIYTRLSPNGEFAAYTAYDPRQDQVVLMLYDGELKQIATDIHEIHSISDDGQYIYASRRNGEEERILYCIRKDGKMAALGPRSDTVVYTNADCTQLLFHRYDGTYLSSFGKKPEKISQSQLTPLMPPSTQSVTLNNTTTLPAYNLYKQVYLTDDLKPDAWYVSEEGSHLLEYSVDHCTLDDSGSYFYYLRGGAICYMPTDIPDAGKTVLAEGVLYNSFALSADRSFIAYVSNEGICKRSGLELSAPSILQGALLTPNARPVLMFSPDGLLYCISEELVFTYLQDNSIVFSMDTFSYSFSPNRELYIVSSWMFSSIQGVPSAYYADGTNPKLLWNPVQRIEFT